MTDTTDTRATRRDVMKGVGGLAVLSMSGATVSEAQEALNADVPTDPHTRDTWRSIVDAIIPRTPQLGEELGPEHVPGGLGVELEKFLIWDFNNFQEVRLGPLDTAGGSDGSSLAGPAVAPEMLELRFDATNASNLEALQALAGSDAGGALEPHLEFGSLERIAVVLADRPIVPDDEGRASFDLSVRTSEGNDDRTVQNYPYAPIFAVVFDVVAADLLARGENEDEPGTNEEFSGGGTFVRLSREDRLRALWSIVDGGVVDRLDELLAPLVTDLGILKFVVMATNGLHGFGYYTEWAGYGDTNADRPADRELETDPAEVQSRTQTEYPGPADGYAVDWRYAVDGGFTDEWEREDERREPPVDAPGGRESGEAPAVDDRAPPGGEL